MIKDRKQKQVLRSAENIKWIPVSMPVAWRPVANQELIGYYGGSDTRKGSSGDYEIHIVHTETNTYYVSGTMVCNLFNASDVGQGELVRVVFLGNRDLKNGHFYKEFQLYKGVSV